MNARKTATRLAPLAVCGLVLAGCASVSVPFGDLFETDPTPLHTASIDGSRSADEAPDATEMPPALNAVAPVQPAPDGTPSERPVDALIASLEDQDAATVSLTQSDLDAMGRALTHVLENDPDAGTFAWSHEATGRAGLMTPFRRLNPSGQGACRVVSVEITDGEKDAILLADACLQGEAWTFVTPRAGQAL